MELTENQKTRIDNINYVASSIGLLGAIAGVIYSHKTGGGFWRGVGYWILGGVSLGTVAALATLPFKNNILKEGDNNTESTGDKESNGMKYNDTVVSQIVAQKRN